MNCSHCNKKFLELDDICFLTISPLSVHLIVKPEKRVFAQENITGQFEDNSITRVKCIEPDCQSNLGKKIPMGPASAMVIAFGTDKVHLFAHLTKKDKWYALYNSSHYTSIEQRTKKNFYGNTEADSMDTSHSLPVIEYDPIIFPSIDTPSHAKFDDVLKSKIVPREFQITCYLEALQRDIIIVLPTGSGKTLIATMLAAKMHQLNPNLMALFIVDRVPLVFQQADSISEDTLLSVCRLCGETNTKLIRRKLRDGEFGVLVTTAGAVLNLLDTDELSLRAFSVVVFDECHHASGQHDYAKILSLLQCLEASKRPRIIGLTASPLSPKTDMQTTVKLVHEFRQTFFNAPICHNINLGEFSFAQQKIKLVSVPDGDRAFHNCILTIVSQMAYVADLINRSRGEVVIRKEPWDDPHCMLRLKMYLGNLEYMSRNEETKRLISLMRRYCAALEISELVGVHFAQKVLDRTPLAGKLKDYPDTSPRLAELLVILRKFTNKSKILIFVHTRMAGDVLTDILQSIADIKEAFSPLKIFGHGGDQGMSWDDEQCDVIQSFRGTECNLLVSTSVLEEGLDVPACDVVIRFDGIKSVISFVQSKGRARKIGASEFILILSQRERQRYEEVEHLEAILKKTLNYVDRQSDIEIPSKKTLSVQLYLKTDLFDNEESQYTTATECAIEFYVSGTHELSIIQEHIANIVYMQGYLSLKRIDSDGSNRKSRGVFPPEDSLIVCGVKSGDVYKSYIHMTISWNYYFDELNDSPFAWTKLELKMPSTQSSWPAERLMWGSFVDKSTVFVAQQHIHDATVQFTPRRCMKLDFSDSTIEIEINYVTLQHFVLAYWQDSSVTLFLLLASCPIVRKLNDDETHTRLTCHEFHFLSHFAQYPVFAVVLPYDKSNWFQIWSLLHNASSFSVPLFDARINITSPSPIIPAETISSQHPSCNEKTMQDCLWALSVLKSTRNVCVSEETIDFITKLVLQADSGKLHVLTQVMYKISNSYSTDNTYYFLTISDFINKELKLSKSFQTQIPEPPFNYRYIESAILTPSRTICLPPIVVQCNRLYRKYPNERFILVAFRDEQSQRLLSRDAIERVKHILENGFAVEGSHFSYLLSSASQLQDQRAVFIQNEATRPPLAKLNEIRFQLLGGTVIDNEIKFLSRLGLFCTSDTPTVSIDRKDVSCIDDLKAGNDLLLTDGNGKMKNSLAHRIIETVGYTDIHPPSALQVRLAGYKGVLTLVDAQHDEDFNMHPGSVILVRPSMEKIEWTDSILNIVKPASYNPLYINKEVINILTSLNDPIGGWDPKPFIRKLHCELLSQYGLILRDFGVAESYLVKNVHNYFKSTSKYFDIITKRYFLSLLRCIYSFHVRNLRSKARIPIEQGCFLMGIPDPVSVLNEDEIFVQIEMKPHLAPNGVLHTKLINGPVLLYKHPCLHPGDLLTPTAVDRPELRHLKNVIVFPIKGRTSLPSSTSGGDLDGDEFAVIWQAELVPPQHCQYPPLNYTEIADRALQQQNQADAKIPLREDIGNLQERLSEAYCRVMSNDSIGKVATDHMALCDQLEDGACHALSMKVAEAQCLSVDFPKTGVAPTMPDEVGRMVREIGFPDFMEKEGSMQYPSKKLLGELYRNTKSICYEMDGWRSILNYTGRYHSQHRLSHDLSDHFLYVAGCEGFMEEAKRTYLEYANSFQRIMTSFGIETEAEVVLGLIIHCHPMVGADKWKTTQVLNAVVRDLFDQFRKVFFKGVAHGGNECLKKASAWYLTAYTRNSDPLSFRSFPWLVGDYLCEIASKVERGESDLHRFIGESAREYISENSDYIRTIVESKLASLPLVESAVLKVSLLKIFSINCFGSVSLFLCESPSDLDVSLSLTPAAIDVMFTTEKEKIKFKELSLQKQRMHILSTYISPAIEEITHNKEEKFNALVPLISFLVDSPLDANNQVNIDITIQSDGVPKCEYILQLYRSTGGVFFGWLWILVHWARHVGILKCQALVDHTGMILSAEFQALALYVYNKMSCKPKFEPLSAVQLSPSLLLDQLKDRKCDSILGTMLEEFFWLGTKITSSQDSIVYEWPIEGRPTHTIEGVILKQISTLLFQAWHCIVYTRDLNKLFEQNDTPSTLKKRLSFNVSNRIRSAQDFHKTRLSNMTGATVSIEESGRHLVVCANGSASSIHKVSVELSRLERMTSHTKKFFPNSNKYMLEDSMLVVLANQPLSARVKLKSFENDCFKLYHSNNERSFPVYSSEVIDPHWKSHATLRIQFMVLDQMKKFPSDRPDLLEKLFLKTRFGFFYVLDGNESICSIGRSLSLEDLERYLLKSKRYRRKITREFTVSQTANAPDGFTPLASLFNPVLRKSSKPAKEKRYMGCSFCPGIQGIGSEEDAQSVQSIYVSALQQCGFTQCHHTDTLSWKLDVQASTNHDVRIRLDDKMQVLQMNERPLIWILATIIADRNVTNPNRVYDTRMRIESTEEVTPDSDLFKHIFPRGMVYPLLSLDKEGKPVVCDYLNTRVKLLRRFSFIASFKLNNVTAKISTGTEYSGRCVELGRRFCELSLVHGERELREAIAARGGKSAEILSIAADAVDISLKLSEAISILSS